MQLTQCTDSANSTHCFLHHRDYVFIRIILFVCWQDYTKTIQLIFTKFSEKVAHEPRKNDEAGFLQAGRPCCHPASSVKALKGYAYNVHE